MAHVNGSYFFGNKISEYGLDNRRVDYATLAKAFDCVLNNDIIRQTNGVIGDWEVENGSEEYYQDTDGNRYDYEEAQERIEELEAERDALEDDIGMLESEQEEMEENDQDTTEIEKRIEAMEARRDEMEADIDALHDAEYDEVFQYYIISAGGANILKHWTDELVWYNYELDMHVWGVTHYGTSWDYVLTDIRCNVTEAE